MKPSIISHFVMLGDSLTDRGTANRRKILRYITELERKSPKGRFTNGYTWSDHISARLISEFIIRELKTEAGMSPSDIADAIIHNEPRVKELVHGSYSLGDDLCVKYKGSDFVRNYDEGGLTSHDYSWAPSTSISRFATRLIVSTLGAKLAQLLAYDQENPPSKIQKAQTLIVEWSGANDLITVNAEPSMLEVDRAIRSRITHAEQLIKSGYRNFVLFNLPDLSLCPHFQSLSAAERSNAHQCTEYFNAELARACRELNETYPHCSIDVFDVNSVFKEIYDEPEKYGFDRDKRSRSFIRSPEFTIRANGTSPANGYMFWDGIHPSADMHALLADRFYEKYAADYNFSSPLLDSDWDPEIPLSTEQLLLSFVKKYSKVLEESQGFFNPHPKPDIPYRTATLEEILRKSFDPRGELCRRVISELQWIDEQGNLKLNIPVLRAAMVQARMEEASKGEVMH
ncbi:Phosphatidylcholine-sterol acyltransferase precursor [Legionella massiliensis]|uniref:Phosphatidylcholine-sterol acyltransferase n=1 Tax=Legionella massiliensis TaxID=1034943 RepID=A0A078KYD4_9GAMM|nr:SGNH/GDSL hydrolase family protein [Legionella massiliensis]CDZ77926.1 Phosphatidylcholine-sterol acyltransferase precursor [Legionella massiliensis]CEE13664.1 Phosphatidylcholine-sterol acyltransferase precursor [Legionella massiliensis]